MCSSDLVRPPLRWPPETSKTLTAIVPFPPSLLIASEAMTPQRRNILTLERQVAARNHQEAVLAALDILTSIDERYGRLDQAELNGIALAGSDEEVALVFSTRFAAAFGRLLSDPEFVLSAVDYERLLLHHRWIDLLFGLSGFRDSDHLMHLLAKHGPNGQMTFDGNNLLRLFCSLSMNTRVNIDLDRKSTRLNSSH